MRHYKERFRSLFGEELLQARYRMCLTQEEMSERMGISARSYSDLERGKRGPSALSLMGFLQILTQEERYRMVEAFRALEEEGEEQ